MDREIVIKFDSVSFSYSDVSVLEDASFHVHRGEFVAMVGPNGSGKTTVLKLLFGLEKQSKGTIYFFGVYSEPRRSEASGTKRNSNNNSVPQCRRENSFSYVSQHMPADNLFPITVRDIVRMGMLRPLKSYAKDKNAVNEALEKTGIADLASRPYRSLSGGQKRRALVARALAANPDLLVLDEPTANMDNESEMRLYETLGAYKGKTTILVVTHDTEFVSSLTDRVLCLGDGRKIVQHGVDVSAPAYHGDPAQHARVLHGENIDDECCK